MQLPSGTKVASFLAGLLVLLLLVGGLIWLGAGRDRQGDGSEFNERAAPGVAGAAGDRVIWTTWGRSAAHDRYVRGTGIKPPFVEPAWTFDAEETIEFPPAIVRDRLFLPVSDGALVALDRSTGAEAWRRRAAGALASSPLVVGDVVYQTSKEGSLQAFAVDDGEELWRFATDGPVESSPIHVDGRIIFGSHDNKLYAVETAAPHRAAWTVQGGAAFKGAPAFAGGTVYAGNYDGNVYAVRATDGAVLWKTQTRRDFSFGGSLYSSPTVAYGRVYVGSTDGRVYAIGADTGEVRWISSTRDWVYASPAVANQTVFVGSYDGTFYALDAKTGEERWTFDADDRIAGSATVIDEVVYFSSLGGTTYGLDIETGIMRWSTSEGRSAGVVTDGEWVFLSGESKQFAFSPASTQRPTGAKRASASD